MMVVVRRPGTCVAMLLGLVGCPRAASSPPDAVARAHDDVPPARLPRAAVAGPTVRVGDLVDLHPPIVEGLLAADAVSTALAQHVDEVARCYEARLAIDPGLAGRVELRLVVGALGRVMDVPTASGAGPIAPVGACVADVARGWRFPPPEMSGIAVVRATFALHPSANASARDR